MPYLDFRHRFWYLLTNFRNSCFGPNDRGPFFLSSVCESNKMISDFEKVKSLIETVCERVGCKLYDVEFQSGSKGRGRKLLIYLDKENGVSLDDCERVSRGVSEGLDANEDENESEYILEVSSPGLEKPLKQKWHFESVIGQQISVQARESILPDSTDDKKKEKPNYKRFKVTGFLNSVDNDKISVKAEGKTFDIPLDHIKKANVVFDFSAIKAQKN